MDFWDVCGKALRQSRGLRHAPGAARVRGPCELIRARHRGRPGPGARRHTWAVRDAAARVSGAVRSSFGRVRALYGRIYEDGLPFSFCQIWRNGHFSTAGPEVQRSYRLKDRRTPNPASPHVCCRGGGERGCAAGARQARFGDAPALAAAFGVAHGVVGCARSIQRERRHARALGRLRRRRPERRGPHVDARREQRRRRRSRVLWSL